MSRSNKTTTNVETTAVINQFDGNDVQSPVIVANADIDVEVPSVSDAIEIAGSLDEEDIQFGENTSNDELTSSIDDQAAANSKPVADDDSQIDPQSFSDAEAQSSAKPNATKTRSKAEVRILKLPVIIEMQRNAARGMIVTPRGVVEIAKSDTVKTTDRAVVVFAAGFSNNGKGNIKIYVEPKDPEDLQDFYNHMMLAVMCAKAGKPVPVFPWSKAKVVY